LLLLLFAVPLNAQTELRKAVAATAAEAKGKAAIACALPGTILNCDVNPHAHPPMQSVFKLPLAVTALPKDEAGELKLDEPVRFTPGDRIPHTLSPLQDRYPEGNVDVPLRELLRLAVEMSDNVAADILLRRLGGPDAVQAGPGFHLQDSEATLH